MLKKEKKREDKKSFIKTSLVTQTAFPNHSAVFAKHCTTSLGMVGSENTLPKAQKNNSHCSPTSKLEAKKNCSPQNLSTSWPTPADIKPTTATSNKPLWFVESWLLTSHFCLCLDSSVRLLVETTERLISVWWYNLMICSHFQLTRSHY